MVEYIEREAIRNSVESIDWYSVYKGKLTAGAPNTENALYKASSIYAAIDNAPAADVAPVVRCRDCKHAWIHPCGYVYCHRDGRNAYEMAFNLDSFCSYGERKEGTD